MDEKTIDKYYSSVDKNIINSLCKNNNLKNLINLSTNTDLYVFNKKNKRWNLKSKDKLLKECETIKKKELKTSSSMLANLAKLGKTNETDDVKTICDNLQNKITTIDTIIDCIHSLDLTTDLIKVNYEETEFKPNIVSFNEIKIVDIGHDLSKYKTRNLSNTSEDDFIECYSNC